MRSAIRPSPSRLGWGCALECELVDDDDGVSRKSCRYVIGAPTGYVGEYWHH